MASPKAVTLEYKQDLGLHSNIDDINHPIAENAPFHFKFFQITDEVENTLYQILDRFLLQLDLIIVRDSVLAAMKETVTNAIKANAKRVFFKNRASNIENEAEYEAEITEFKKTYLENREVIEDSLQRNNFGVFVSFIHNKSLMRIRIMNNVQLTATESARIKERIDKAKTYNDLADAFMDMSSEQEGAGLGLIMTLMMLRNDGLGDSAFKFESSENKTVFMIDIPSKVSKENQQLEKIDHIVSQIDNLPTFPKAIKDIQDAIDKPNSSIGTIAEMIKRDIALSANILKLSNSAAFRRGGKVESLDRAIQLIGLKELQTLLYSLGTKQMLEDKFPAFTAIWEKSNESAFYCKAIGQKMGMNKADLSNLIAASLLHDIGEILLLSFDKQHMLKIKTYSNSREIASTISMEESAIGITHSRLGAMVGEKWNFPILYTKAMEFHHRPLLADDVYADIVFPIYLSDMMISINAKEAKSSEIPSEILKLCKFQGRSEFDSFRTKIREQFLTY